MMQVPVPQHLGSSLIKSFQGLTVGATVVGNGFVVKLHVRASQRTVFGGPPLHAHAPEPKRAGIELGTHEADHLRLTQAHAFVNGLKRGAVFPRHLNHRRHITRTQVGKTLTRTELHSERVRVMCEWESSGHHHGELKYRVGCFGHERCHHGFELEAAHGLHKRAGFFVTRLVHKISQREVAECGFHDLL
jgi:hypothetical protein